MKNIITIHQDPKDKDWVLVGNYYKGNVFINIEYIWNKTKSFNKFTKMFATVSSHEHIHRLIEEELGVKKANKILQVYEEGIVRRLTHERMSDNHKKYYRKQDKGKK